MKTTLFLSIIVLFSLASCTKASKNFELTNTTYGGCFSGDSNLKSDDISTLPSEPTVELTDNGETLSLFVLVFDNCCGNLQEDINFDKNTININLINKPETDLCRCTCRFTYDFEFTKNSDKPTTFNVYHTSAYGEEKLVKTIEYGE